ncbi:MAG: alpha-L-fucosidase [Planctomycetota bacterium]|jgi:alpha-L-fucosidase
MSRLLTAVRATAVPLSLALIASLPAAEQAEGTVAGDVVHVDHKAFGQYQAAAQTAEWAQRTEWYQDAGFGIFVHWGVYAHLGGEWQGNDYGKEMGGASAEWIMRTAKIAKGDYEAVAAEWNPHAYDPDAWCAAAAAAGAKYIVLTTKHHDGFALFDDGDATTWDIVEHNPHAGDLIAPYAEAARKHGLKLGFYYSHKVDWYHRPGLPKKAKGKAKKTGQSAPLTAAEQAIESAYRSILESHLNTLMSVYEPDLIWYDLGGEGDIPQLAHDVARRHNPDVVLGGRIGAGLGDYACMGDRQVPPPGLGIIGESPMTTRLNWGYDKDDGAWKEPSALVRMLSACVTRNCNLLLNQGPHPDGSWLPEELERLAYLGRWMEPRSEAVHGTRGTPFAGEYTWGSLTVAKDQQRIYLHVHTWPSDGVLAAPGITAAVSTATLLGSDQAVVISASGGDGVALTVPTLANPEAVEIIALDCPAGASFDRASGPQAGATMLNPVDDAVIAVLPAVITEVSKRGLNLRKANGAEVKQEWDAPAGIEIRRADGTVAQRSDLVVGAQVVIKRGVRHDYDSIPVVIIIE